MENASKALIIAGAILISIVLITVGVAVLNQGQDVAQSSSLEGSQLTTFNQKFTQYEGNISGSQVKALLNAVLTSNQNETSTGSGWTVTVNGGTVKSTSKYPTNASAQAGVSPATRYNVSCSYANGRVNDIKITT